MVDFDPFNFDRLSRGECCYFFKYVRTHFCEAPLSHVFTCPRNCSQQNAPGGFRENFTDYQSTYPDDLQSDLYGRLTCIRDAVERYTWHAVREKRREKEGSFNFEVLFDFQKPLSLMFARNSISTQTRKYVTELIFDVSCAKFLVYF